MMAESLLATIISRTIDLIQKKQLIDKWFFIRYSDELGYHIRLRFHCLGPDCIFPIIKLLNDCLSTLIEQGCIDNISYGTYNREIERYGEKSYELTESIFHIDSMIVLQVIQTLYSNPDKENKRFKIALLIINSYLEAFGLSLNEKFNISQLIRNSYRKEFNLFRRSDIKRIDENYRKYRKEVYYTMHNTEEQSYKFISQHKEYISSILKRMGNKMAIGDTQYIGSLIHMSLNRLFISQNRLNELVLFDYLCRYYESIKARLKYNNNFQDDIL